MDLPRPDSCDAVRPRTRLRGLRVAVLATAVIGSFIAAERSLGTRGEAFWLLLPLWVGLGCLLKALPPPRLEARGWARAAIISVLVLFPAGFYVFMARLVGGRIDPWELLIAVGFFAVSLEVFLLYAFNALEALRARLSRGRGPRARMAITVLGKGSFYAVLLPFLLATFSLHRVKVPPLPPEAWMELEREDVAFRSRGPRPVELRGWFFPLKQPGKQPIGTVLACHGVAANRGDLLDFVLLLREAGFQTLVFDFRGHGESGGHTVTYGKGEREDVLGAWDHLLSRKDVDRGRLFALGVSMGAASLLLALPEMPEARAAVIDSSFAELEAMVRWQYRFLPDPLAAGMARLTEVFGWLETGMWVSEVAPIRAMERLSLPIQFFHGGDDPVIPPAATESLFQAHRGPKRMRIQPGAAHGGTAGAHPHRWRDEVRTFFLEAIP